MLMFRVFVVVGVICATDSVVNDTCSFETDTAIGSGAACGSIQTTSAGDCCVACSKNASCRSFTFDEHRETCYLKDNSDHRGHEAGRISGTYGPPPTPLHANVTFSTNGVANTVSPLYASYSLDTSSNRGWYVRNITDTRLLTLAAALGPVVLRVGGSGNNCVKYNVPSSAPKQCQDDAVCCMNQSQWDNLNAFAAATNTSLVFGLRPASGGNASDIVSLFDYTVSSKYYMYGFEFGNEVGCSKGNDFVTLNNVINQAWASNINERPFLVGPDPLQGSLKNTTMDVECVSGFFNDTAGTKIHAFTYHYYLQTSSPTYTARELNGLRTFAQPIQDAVNKYGGAAQTKLWAGEMGGHSGGGTLGVTNSFASAQWYLDSLGLLAVMGHTVHVRQDLVGGNYGLLEDNFPFGEWVPRDNDNNNNNDNSNSINNNNNNNSNNNTNNNNSINNNTDNNNNDTNNNNDDNNITDGEDHHRTNIDDTYSKLNNTQQEPSGYHQPNNSYTVLPDYWALLVWKQVMGTRVLQTVVTNTSGDASTLRAYAHCTLNVDSAATLLLINIGATASKVVLPGNGSITMWEMLAPNNNVTSKAVELNGQLLQVGPDGDVPTLRGVDKTHVTEVTIAPQSYSFVVVYGVVSTLCGI